MSLSIESFGIECGRLAGLPETILTVASKCASCMQREVEQRRRRYKYVGFAAIYVTLFNLTRRVSRAMKLIDQCLKTSGIIAAAAMEDLDTIINSRH